MEAGDPRPIFRKRRGCLIGRQMQLLLDYKHVDVPGGPSGEGDVTRNVGEERAGLRRSIGRSTITVRIRVGQGTVLCDPDSLSRFRGFFVESRPCSETAAVCVS